jgi:hypothetical protein
MDLKNEFSVLFEEAPEIKKLFEEEIESLKD